ncbi:hypothetical protein B0H14DRAFT_2634267 [Mycena olivaceomarginata]|nr:hypothetical protein B0H14DRAFT_2634267 [Mycena olivaceomarginata]
MYPPKASLPAVLALMLSGAGEQLTGTVDAQGGLAATLGFEETTNCDCPRSNGPFVAVPKELVADHRCCEDTITVQCTPPDPTALQIGMHFPEKKKSVVVILGGMFDQGKGTENIELSPMAFAMISDNPTDTTLGPVTWLLNRKSCRSTSEISR